MLAAGFELGQIIRVGGIGEARTYLQRCACFDDGREYAYGRVGHIRQHPAGIIVGAWIMVPGAHSQPVMVSAFNPGTGVYTVVNGDGTAANASASVTGGVYYCDDTYGRITGIFGTTLTLDTTSTDVLPNASDHTNTLAYHAGCGVAMRNSGTIRNVFCGDAVNPTTNDLEGFGVWVYGSHGSIPGSSANGWTVDRLFTYGCQHGLKVQGVDGNAGMNTAANHLSSRSWSIIDFSFLGNVHAAPEMSGGSGMISRDGVGEAAVTIIGLYNEGGTPR